MKTINKIQKFIKNIKTIFYNSLLATIVRKKHDTRILNSMEDYKINFDLDSKIAWNRHKLREQFEMYKKIENYYALFFAYIALLGFGMFDIFKNIVFKCSSDNIIFNILVLICCSFIILSFYSFWKVLQLKEFKFDNRPFQIYKGAFNSLKEKYENEDEKQINERCFKAYLTKLEEYVNFNHDLYMEKKNNVKKMVLMMFYVFLLYIPLLTYTKMCKVDDSNTIPDEVLIENLVKKHVITSFSEYEKKHSNKTIIITTSQLEEIVRKIVKEELEKEKQNKGQK